MIDAAPPKTTAAKVIRYGNHQGDVPMDSIVALLPLPPRRALAERGPMFPTSLPPPRSWLAPVLSLRARRWRHRRWWRRTSVSGPGPGRRGRARYRYLRSEEHTSELQSLR